MLEKTLMVALKFLLSWHLTCHGNCFVFWCSRFAEVSGQKGSYKKLEFFTGEACEDSGDFSSSAIREM